MADPTVSIPSLRAFLGQIALSKSTAASPNRGLYGLQGGLVQGDMDVRDVVNAIRDTVDTLAVGGFTAGGDLTGTSSSQTVAKIQGVAISGTPAAGAVLNATTPTAAAWTTTPTIGGLSFLSTSTVSVSQAAKAAAAASQAGSDLTWTAQSATAGTATPGAAAGGSIILVAGNGAQFSSGNANGGDVRLRVGAPGGAGLMGSVKLLDSTGTTFVTFSPYGILSFANAVSGPFFGHGGQTTDTATSDLTIQSQAPWASATTNKSSGNLLLVTPAPVSGGTAGKISFQIGGSETARLDSTGLWLTSNLQLLLGDSTHGESRTNVYQFTTNSDGTAKVCASIALTASSAIKFSATLTLKRVGATGSYFADVDGAFETDGTVTITTVRAIATVATPDVNGSTTPTVAWSTTAGANGQIQLTITVPNTQTWDGTLDVGRTRAA